MKRYLLIVISLLLGANFVSAQVYEQTFEEGNKLYAEANFKAAASQYQKIVDAGYASSKLFYNLGNAYYKQKQYAKAILYFEKAYVLNPSDSQIKHNLEFTRLQTRDKIEAIPSFFIKEWADGIRNLLSANGWSWLSLASILSAGILFILYRFTGTIFFKKIYFFLSCFFVLVLIVAIWNANSKTQSIRYPNSAIVLAPVVVVKSSPDQSGKELYVIHEGTKITLTDTPSVPGWREIKIADGNVGWVQNSTFEVI